MKDLIKKVLTEQLENKSYLTEMAKSDWCKARWSEIYPEYHFCVSAENYIKNELDDVIPQGRRTAPKKVFSDFENAMIKFYNQNVKEGELENRIIRITKDSPIFIEGQKEVEDANEKLKSNCSKFMTVVNKHLNEFETKVKLYYLDNEQYSIENRLSTNYSALAVLFTKFFEQKGAFDDVRPQGIDWNKIAKNWISHLFHPSVEFEDIRPEDIKENPTYDLSSLSFQELAKIYFKGSTVFGSADIIKSVNEVLDKVRGVGFDSENLFEKKYLDGKKYIRYAKDYGFVDMFSGVDFIIKSKDKWIPIQVKTSATEPTYKISTLGCNVYYIVEKKGKDDFKVIKYSTPDEDIFGN